MLYCLCQVRFENITINKMSFKASITKLQRKPVTIYVDHIDMNLYEPFALQGKPAPKDPLPPKSYGVADRISDGIRIEINEIRLRLRTLGRRKCMAKGAWNPPLGLLVFKNVVYCSVDEMGYEGDLEDCWKYNKGRKRDYYVFKKLTVESGTFSVASAGRPPSVIMDNLAFDGFFTFLKSLYDVNVTKAMEVDIRMGRPRIDLNHSDGSYSDFVHFMLGWLYCFSKPASQSNNPGK